MGFIHFSSTSMFKVLWYWFLTCCIWHPTKTTPTDSWANNLKLLIIPEMSYAIMLSCANSFTVQVIHFVFSLINGWGQFKSCDLLLIWEYKINQRLLVSFDLYYSIGMTEWNIHRSKSSWICSCDICVYVTFLYIYTLVLFLFNN